MRPIHILSVDPTAGVVAAEVSRRGSPCSAGPAVDTRARFVLIPLFPPGDSQADRLTADDVLRGVRNAEESTDGEYECSLFVVLKQGDGRDA